MAVSHYIYKLTFKVGCTRDLVRTLRQYPPHQLRLIEVVEILRDASNDEALERRRYWSRYFGLKRRRRVSQQRRKQLAANGAKVGTLRGTCPHCGVAGSLGNLANWHLDMCPKKLFICRPGSNAQSPGVLKRLEHAGKARARQKKGMPTPAAVAKPKVMPTRPGLPIKWLITRPALVGRPGVAVLG